MQQILFLKQCSIFFLIKLEFLSKYEMYELFSYFVEFFTNTVLILFTFIYQIAFQNYYEVNVKIKCEIKFDTVFQFKLNSIETISKFYANKLIMYINHSKIYI